MSYSIRRDRRTGRFVGATKSGTGKHTVEHKPSKKGTQGRPKVATKKDKGSSAKGSSRKA